MSLLTRLGLWLETWLPHMRRPDPWLDRARRDWEQNPGDNYPPTGDPSPPLEPAYEPGPPPEPDPYSGHGGTEQVPTERKPAAPPVPGA